MTEEKAGRIEFKLYDDVVPKVSLLQPLRRKRVGAHIRPQQISAPYVRARLVLHSLYHSGYELPDGRKQMAKHSPKASDTSALPSTVSSLDS